MRVLLLSDVAGIGKRGEVVEVKDGYAQNYLIPRKLAEFADKRVAADAIKHTREKITQQSMRARDLKRTVKQLDGKKIVLHDKANEQGHLFAQIHKNAVVKAIADQYGVIVPQNVILFSTPIKALGSHTVKLSSGTATMGVLVVEVQKIET